MAILPDMDLKFGVINRNSIYGLIKRYVTNTLVGLGPDILQLIQAGKTE
jgi:hypothetical protein